MGLSMLFACHEKKKTADQERKETTCWKKETRRRERRTNLPQHIGKMKCWGVYTPANREDEQKRKRERNAVEGRREIESAKEWVIIHFTCFSPLSFPCYKKDDFSLLVYLKERKHMNRSFSIKERMNTSRKRNSSSSSHEVKERPILSSSSPDQVNATCASQRWMSSSFITSICW